MWDRQLTDMSNDHHNYKEDIALMWDEELTGKYRDIEMIGDGNMDTYTILLGTIRVRQPCGSRYVNMYFLVGGCIL